MGKVVLIMTMAWHWLACAYWFVCDLENFGETVFSSRDSHNFFSPPVELWCQSAEECPDDCVAAGLCPAKMSFKYSHCFFWAVEVTFGIGQDIRPTTELETNFVIFCILVGVIMFSVIIGQMTASLAALRVDHDFQDRKMQKIKDYLQRHRVPWHMKDRIYGYYRYMWSAKQSDHGGAASLEDLHPTLRLELKLHTNRIFLSSIRMFAHISDPYCLLDFVEKLKPLICVPDEYVISWGETLNELYIVRRGSIELTEREPGSLHLTCLDDGDVFGDRALLTPFRYRSRNLEAQSLVMYEILVVYCV